MTYILRRICVHPCIKRLDKNYKKNGGLKNMKKLLKVFLGLAIIATVALSCVACSVGTWLDQLVCEHEFDDGVVTKEATCSEFGELTKTCALCEKTEVENIDKLEHTIIMMEEVESTCTKTGLTSGTKCSVCDTVIVEPQEVPAKGHKVVIDETVKATCLTTGLTEGSHCERCSEVIDAQTVIPALGHSLVSHEQVDATCETAGHSAYSECTTCKVKYGYEEYEAGHKLNALGNCSACGLINTSAITLENLNYEEYFTKTELKVGDVIELDKVVLSTYITNISFKTSDGYIFRFTDVCFGNDWGGEYGYGLEPDSDQLVYKRIVREGEDYADILLYIPANSHLVFDGSSGGEDAAFDYQFTDMSVTITSIFAYENEVPVSAYVYTPVA